MKRILYVTFAITLFTGSSLFWSQTMRAYSQAEIDSSVKLHGKDLVLSKHLKKHEHSGPVNYSKGRSPIHTQLERIDDGKDAKLIRLKGTVTVRADFENLKVFWGLPKDVEVVSGAEEVMTKIFAGESQSFEIFISQNSTENRLIHFQAQTIDKVEGENLGSSAQYNTTKQEQIAKELKENYLKARAKVKSGELRKIVF